MFAKALFQKIKQPTEHNMPQGSVTSEDLNPRIAVHHGIPSTASILAFDPIQHLLALGTLDGRIKVIGGENIEGLLISPEKLPFKNLEFLQNQGFLVSISSENNVQVWDLEHRCAASCLQWESNITAFSVIYGTHYMYVGDEHGRLSVLKYVVEEGKLSRLPYVIPTSFITEAVGIQLPSNSIVGVLSQPCSNTRLLIAYESGLIVIWDFSEDKVVLVRGHTDLNLKNKFNDFPKEELSHDTLSDNEQEEKEITALCWASFDGLILAVGYVDGDIMFWNLNNADKPSNEVVKLQLSSANRRLPVIVLNWLESKSYNNYRGQLFVYGGDEIGSQEVLTIVSLDWSSGMETLKCVSRVDLTLYGSFADMVLVPNSRGNTGENTSLFVLTNPGQLHVYYDICFSSLTSKQDKNASIPVLRFPMAVSTIEPSMTVTKLSLVDKGGEFSTSLSEIVIGAKRQDQTRGSMNWPLTGGVPSQICCREDNRVERVFMAGYQDGTVRIWNATYPDLSLILVLESEVKGFKVAGANASVSALDLCSSTLSLAIGNECGLVCLYKLNGSSEGTTLHFVTKADHEVHSLDEGDGPHCTAVFSLLSSPIQSLKFATLGAKLAVGYDSGRVAMLDITSLAVLFLTDSIFDLTSPVISLDVRDSLNTLSSMNSPEESESGKVKEPTNCLFVLNRDAQISVIDGGTSKSILSNPIHPEKESTAISMHILEGSLVFSEVSSEKHSLNTSLYDKASNETEQINSPSKRYLLEVKKSYPSQRLMDLSVLLCCEDALYLYSLKLLVQGENYCARKVNLVKTCSWTTVFKRDGKECGLVLLYQTGCIEIRSLPDLDVVEESSLISILRWNVKTNMVKTMSSSDSGQITLVNGCEFAFISLLAYENDFRLPESLSCLHDKVLAAASVPFSQIQKNEEVTPTGILGGIITGFKGDIVETSLRLKDSQKANFSHLDSLFARSPLFNQPEDVTHGQHVVDLKIDDIEIDETLRPTSPHMSKSEKRDKETERDKLFEGATSDTQPRFRTPDEIKAKYRKAGDASSAASQARDKLVHRQEKLERISRRTEELQSGAENFAAMASDLAKTMEKRKWWNL